MKVPGSTSAAACTTTWIAALEETRRCWRCCSAPPIIFPDDFSALGGYNAWPRRLGIPEDISVMGYDGIYLGGQTLAGDHQQEPTKALGRLAADKLIELDRASACDLPEQIRVSGKLLDGGSRPHPLIKGLQLPARSFLRMIFVLMENHEGGLPFGEKISRRNFLLASGVVTIGAALAARRQQFFYQCCCFLRSASPAARFPAVRAASAEGKVLNICAWNDEFQSRFNDYYPEVKEIAADKSTTTLKDGTLVKWTINANENNNYQNKLDEALLNQDSAADDSKIDIFLIEADYALQYVDSDYVLDVKKDIGLTDSDLAGQYQYTKDIVSVDGSQRGTTWQATPGLFAYRRSIAKAVLGTDDPTEVQSCLSDWDKFNDVAAKAAAKGYKMLSGFDDAYRTFSNNVSAPWVSGTTVTVDPNLMKWVDQTKEYTDKGYNNKSSLWDSQWASDQGPTGKVFGFFYSTWGINFTLLGNSLATPTSEGGKEEVGNGIYGDYAVCEGPQPYYWGGTWICGAAGSDNLETIKDVMLKLTCDEAIMKQITMDTQDYTNNEKAMNEIANSDFKSDFLGGQNHIALFAEAAAKIDMSNAGPYDQGLNESFQTAFKDYFTGNVKEDAAKANFETAIKEKYPELTEVVWPA